MIDKHPSRYKRRRVPTRPALPRLHPTLSLLSYTPRLPNASRMKNHKLQMEEEEVKLQGEVCCNSTPPLIYIGGCHPSSTGGMELLQLELTLWTNDMFPRGWLRRWGPRAWSAGQPKAPTAPSFGVWAILADLMSKQGARPCPKPI